MSCNSNIILFIILIIVIILVLILIFCYKDNNTPVCTQISKNNVYTTTKKCKKIIIVNKSKSKVYGMVNNIKLPIDMDANQTKIINDDSITNSIILELVNSNIDKKINYKINTKDEFTDIPNKTLVLKFNGQVLHIKIEDNLSVDVN